MYEFEFENENEVEFPELHEVAHNITMFIVNVLTEFAMSGRREPIVAALDQIETFEKEYTGHDPHTKIVVDVLVKNWRRMIKEAKE